jgi:hypothetical protein
VVPHGLPRRQGLRAAGGRAGLPEDTGDDTSADDFGEGLERLATRMERRNRIFDRFERRQLLTLEWFPLSRLAVLYADVLCRPDADPPETLLERPRHRAYHHMARGILGGRLFVRNGRSMVLFLNPLGPAGACRLTPDTLRRQLDTRPEEVWRLVLAQCRTAAGLAREWADEHGLSPPASWFPERAARETPTEPRRTTRRQLKDALILLHGDGVDIRSPTSTVEALHTEVETKFKIKASKATFERALSDARADARSIVSIKFPQKGDDGT